ncbi:MAG: phosphoribosylaminoimidazole-succinocarboxamide synthase [Roseivirga sp.]|jgi:phosphoribosylaminoimidazole-succinocarboxamide synthase
MKTLVKTNFKFPRQTNLYQGKVRDVYSLENDLLAMVASDRISAFDVVLPKGIPGKGQVLNQIANYFLDATADLVPNWKIAQPDPMVTVGQLAKPFKVEMVIRACLTGHAWRTYKAGIRVLCGIQLPEGMKENQTFTTPIITPTTKADLGAHDEDISREDILAQGIVSEEDYLVLEDYTRKLFQRGQEMAAKRGLILVDTKYEFGENAQGEIILIDEIHTPDSSRYFYTEGYAEKLEKNQAQKQLSKEFVREWLMENGFQGKEGQSIPEMTEEFILSVSQRYQELYDAITGKEFTWNNDDNLEERIFNNTREYLSR